MKIDKLNKIDKYLNKFDTSFDQFGFGFLSALGLLFTILLIAISLVPKFQLVDKYFSFLTLISYVIISSCLYLSIKNNIFGKIKWFKRGFIYTAIFIWIVGSYTVFKQLINN